MSWGTTELTVRFGPQVALDAVSITIEPGAVQAIIGGDGAGKSTLLRVLAGLGAAHRGEVRLPARHRIGFVPAHGGVFADLTVSENLALVASAHRLDSWRDRADELLGRAGLDPFGHRLAGHLSGGQRRKLAGSMALLPQPDLLLLDEVTTGVDPVSRMELWRMVAGAASAGTAVVAATTYLDEAERAARVELLHQGRLLASGPPAELIDAVPGSITDQEEPTNRARAWRQGRRWHQWHPEGVDSDRRPTLEDAAIVHEILATEEAP